MAKGFTSAGVDFDDLFDPDVMGNGPVAPWLTSAGVALRYAAVAYGTKRPDVGYANSAGIDVANLWAAKGSAVYFPSLVEASSYSFTGLPRSASIRIAIKTNGTITVTTVGTTSTSGAGTHNYVPTAAGASAAFDFRIFGTVYGIRNISSTASITGKGGVNVSAATPPGSNPSFDTGWIASADDAADFLAVNTSSPTGAGASTIQTQNPNVITIQIRRKSDGQIARTITFAMFCGSDSQQ